MLHTLTSAQRMLLMKLVCGCVWADLRVTLEERDHVRKLVAKLGLEPGEAKTVESWLDAPPRTEDIDPLCVPAEHRAMLLVELREIAAVDGNVSEEEAELVTLLEELLG